MSLTIKNYKKLEGWAHDYKELMIGEIIETETEYSFRVGYNKTPYIIKIFRQGTNTNEYEMELRDGMNTTQYGRTWVMKNSIAIDRITNIFEKLIVHHKPKARGINNQFYNNGPF
jgi:hypothetical protein